MTREKAKELLPIIQAFAKGKTIQVWANNTWQDEESPLFWAYAQFRIKPEQKSEPKYRPFKSQEECLNEMMKHQPFGWFRSTHNKNLFNTICINDEYIKTTNIVTKYTDNYSDAFANIEFVDGAPFGINEE